MKQELVWEVEDFQRLEAKIDRVLKYLEESNPKPDQYFTPDEAAKYVNVSKRTLDNWRKSDLLKRPVGFIAVGSIIRYKKSELDAFLESRHIKKR